MTNMGFAREVIFDDEYDFGEGFHLMQNQQMSYPMKVFIGVIPPGCNSVVESQMLYQVYVPWKHNS